MKMGQPLLFHIKILDAKIIGFVVTNRQFRLLFTQ